MQEPIYSCHWQENVLKLMPRSSTGFWGHKGCASSRVQSPALSTQMPPAQYGEGQVTQREMQKKGHRLGFCGNGSQGTSQSSQLLPWLHSHLASSHLDQGVVKKDILLTLWQGIWGGGYSPHSSRRGNWGLKVAASMVLQLHTMAWQDLPLRSFSKELTQEKRQLYVPVQRGLISTRAAAGWICAVLSKQVRITRSGDRGAREEGWGHANPSTEVSPAGHKAGMSALIQLVRGQASPRHNKSSGMMERFLQCQTAGGESPSAVVCLRYEVCWILDTQQWGQGGTCTQKKAEINLHWCAWASS